MSVYCILYFLGGGPGWVGEGDVGQHGGARDVATTRDMISWFVSSAIWLRSARPPCTADRLCPLFVFHVSFESTSCESESQVEGVCQDKGTHLFFFNLWSFTSKIDRSDLVKGNFPQSITEFGWEATWVDSHCSWDSKQSFPTPGKWLHRCHFFLW